jgi:hypothetical protein
MPGNPCSATAELTVISEEAAVEEVTGEAAGDEVPDVEADAGADIPVVGLEVGDAPTSAL